MRTATGCFGRAAPRRFWRAANRLLTAFFGRDRFVRSGLRGASTVTRVASSSAHDSNVSARGTHFGIQCAPVSDGFLAKRPIAFERRAIGDGGRRR